jgi:hypothetical protein
MTLSGDRLRQLRLDRRLALRAAMSEEDASNVERCSGRLEAALTKQAPGDNVVLVAYGGGKDSTDTLAFLRAVQLEIFVRRGQTFTLRAATNRHAGMPAAVMENIERAYRALGFHEDPSCEALLVDGSEISPFQVSAPLPPAVLSRNRMDLLMTGHRTFGEGRPTFCNMSMIHSFGLACAHEPPADLIATGDSSAEQRSYLLWTRRLARRVSSDRRPVRPGFGGFLQSTDAIAGAYFTDLYGDSAAEQIAERRIAHEVSADLTFFSIFEDTSYSAAGHWDLLTGLLGFQFDDVAFSFSESDCGNPTLMAHLRGLRTERLYGRAYGEGLHEYTNFAESLMRAKEFPESLIEVMRARYAGDGAADRMRERANAFAREAYGLGEEQLICLVYSPFTDEGKRLGEYLRREQPDLAAADGAVRLLLAGDTPDDGAQALADRLESLSGLALSWLRVLFGSTSVQLPLSGEGTNLITTIMAGDPHKRVISTRHSPDGPEATEVISGR